MNFCDPRTIGTEMADRFVMSGANLPPPPLFKIGLKCKKKVFVQLNIDFLATFLEAD